MNETISIVWLRRDLRLHDNAALYHALKGNHPSPKAIVMRPSMGHLTKSCPVFLSFKIMVMEFRFPSETKLPMNLLRTTSLVLKI